MKSKVGGRSILIVNWRIEIIHSLNKRALSRQEVPAPGLFSMFFLARDYGVGRTNGPRVFQGLIVVELDTRAYGFPVYSYDRFIFSSKLAFTDGHSLSIML